MVCGRLWRCSPPCRSISSSPGLGGAKPNGDGKAGKGPADDSRRGPDQRRELRDVRSPNRLTGATDRRHGARPMIASLRLPLLAAVAAVCLTSCATTQRLAAAGDVRRLLVAIRDDDHAAFDL